MFIPHTVPGTKAVIAQDGPMTCWATVYAMMISWKNSFQMGIRDSVAQVDEKYGRYYDAGLRSNANPRGLPSSEFGAFLQAAHMRHQPMANLPVEEWANLLRAHGLLWIGTLNTLGARAGLHSRIIEAITGNGSPAGTNFAIIDPAGGRRYNEPFNIFIQKYEGAIRRAGGQYFQIRHF